MHRARLRLASRLRLGPFYALLLLLGDLCCCFGLWRVNLLLLLPSLLLRRLLSRLGVFCTFGVGGADLASAWAAWAYPPAASGVFLGVLGVPFFMTGVALPLGVCWVFILGVFGPGVPAAAAGFTGVLAALGHL